MNEQIDHVAWRAFETSTIARAIERFARPLRTAAKESRLIGLARPWLTAGVAQPGVVVVAAVLTHIVLMVAMARPVSWQWLILPSIALAAGAVLIAARRRAPQE
ncbi:MAG: hypothetical protein K2Y23_04610 [Cyanobacteria bacterium]|nr:hypothetical protein [Cyanobacteriota bacterium]